MLALNGLNTLQSDLDIVLKNEHYLETESTGWSDVYIYDEDHEQTIFIPKSGDVKKEIFTPNRDNAFSKRPLWFQRTYRNVVAIYEEAYKEQMPYQLNKKIRDMAIKKPFIIDQDLATINKRYGERSMKCMEQEMAKPTLRRIFSEAGWVIPYYLYWQTKEGKTTYTAALEIDTNDSSHLAVPEVIGREITKIFVTQGFETLAASEQTNILMEKR